MRSLRSSRNRRLLDRAAPIRVGHYNCIMPTYEYRCTTCDHRMEVFAKMSDPDPAACEKCGAATLEKVLFPVAVHYKGSGFYSTDYSGSRSSSSASSDAGESARSETSASSSPSESTGSSTSSTDSSSKPSTSTGSSDA